MLCLSLKTCFFKLNNSLYNSESFSYCCKSTIMWRSKSENSDQLKLANEPVSTTSSTNTSSPRYSTNSSAIRSNAFLTLGTIVALLGSSEFSQTFGFKVFLIEKLLSICWKLLILYKYYSFLYLYFFEISVVKCFP